MKTSYFYIKLAILPALMMCSDGKNSEKKRADLAAYKIVQNCYLAVDEKDSAFLNLVNYGKGKAKGDLVIFYSGKAKNAGQLSGYINGDTLLLNYHFYIGKDSSRRYTNPLILLKKKDSLILGIGRVVNYLGRSYFDKRIPINFDKGRFHFGLIKCS